MLSHTALPKLAGNRKFKTVSDGGKEPCFSPVIDQWIPQSCKLLRKLVSQLGRVKEIQFKLFSDRTSQFPEQRRFGHHGNWLDTAFDSLSPSIRLTVLHEAVTA